MNEVLNIWNTSTPVEILFFWIYFFVIAGIIGACNFGFKNGHDYSDEVKDKVLDTSDNKWKTQEEYDLETGRQIMMKIEADLVKAVNPIYFEHHHG